MTTPVLLDQASVGLMGQGDLGNSCHRQRIDKAGEDAEQDDKDKRGTQMLEHGRASISGEVEGGDDDVDRLDADEGQDEAAQAIDEKIAPE